MRKQLIAAITAALLMASYSPAQNVSPSELQFRDALHKQQVEGDLTNAIKIYQTIVASSTADRPVKAKALLQLAACYEKLGQKSEAVYQQIVREFADQPAANQARSKLAALRPAAPPAAMAMRKIETGASVQNVVAIDGQRAIYWDPTNTILYSGDLAGKERREVYRTKRIPMVVPSRDLGMLFFYLPPSPGEQPAYAVIKSDGTGYRELTLTENGVKVPVGDIGTAPPACLSWSWDNRFLLMCKRRQSDSRTRLLRITVADGVVEDLLPTGNASEEAQFSPDGRFIAYHEGYFLGPVRVMPAQGGMSQLIYDNATLLDWTRDGRYLMIGENRPGTSGSSIAGLTAVPMQNGRRSGEPIPIEVSLPLTNSRPRMTPSGAIVLQIGTGPTQQVLLGTFDAEDHFGPWKPLELVEGSPGLSWSPDSRQIVYIARGALSLTSVVRIRHVGGSEDRELYRSNSPLFQCLWARQRQTVYCSHPSGNQTEILSIALDSGRAEKVGELDGMRLLHFISADDRFLYTAKAEGATSHEWEIGTDRDRRAATLFRSVNGRWAYGVQSESGHRYLTVRPADSDGQDSRRLVELNTQASPGFSPIPIRITEDGNWIVYRNSDSAGKVGLYRIATTGGEPQRLADIPNDALLNLIVVSPDAKSIILSTADSPRKTELWALENFLPAAAKAVAK